MPRLFNEQSHLSAMSITNMTKARTRWLRFPRWWSKCYRFAGLIQSNRIYGFSSFELANRLCLMYWAAVSQSVHILQGVMYAKRSENLKILTLALKCICAIIDFHIIVLCLLKWFSCSALLALHWLHSQLAHGMRCTMLFLFDSFPGQDLNVFARFAHSSRGACTTPSYWPTAAYVLKSNNHIIVCAPHFLCSGLLLTSIDVFIPLWSHGCVSKRKKA